MGENCSANSRLIVHEKIKPDLMARLEAQLRNWRSGDPLDPANQLGALIDEEHFEKVNSYLVKLNERDVAFGNAQATKPYVTPVVVDNVKPDDPLAKEEIFGPVLSVLSVKTDEQAIQLANDTMYGLTASIFSSNSKKALRAARAIRAGTITVNTYGEGDITTPFGGYKQSGFGGRDNSLHAHDQYTELKTIWVDLGDDEIDESVD